MDFYSITTLFEMMKFKNTNIDELIPSKGEGLYLQAYLL